jgi:hypothetical protein
VALCMFTHTGCGYELDGTTCGLVERLVLILCRTWWRMARGMSSLVAALPRVLHCTRVRVRYMVLGSAAQDVGRTTRYSILVIADRLRMNINSCPRTYLGWAFYHLRHSRDCSVPRAPHVAGSWAYVRERTWAR